MVRRYNVYANCEYLCIILNCYIYLSMSNWTLYTRLVTQMYTSLSSNTSWPMVLFFLLWLLLVACCLLVVACWLLVVGCWLLVVVVVVVVVVEPLRQAQRTEPQKNWSCVLVLVQHDDQSIYIVYHR